MMLESVYDAGPTSNQHKLSVSRLEGWLDLECQVVGMITLDSLLRGVFSPDRLSSYRL